MSAQGLEFKPSRPLSLGMELELQIVNTRDFDLTRGAPDLLRLAVERDHPGDIKPEITESMIEVSTAIHAGYSTLLGELRAARDALAGFADRLNLAIAGGGAHPFQHWSAQRIFSAPRFAHLSELYGYLAKQFTVFGQHVHVGCPSGDDAVYLVHRLSRYIPHFIVFSGSSPFYQGQDTAFHSSRFGNTMPCAASAGSTVWLRSWYCSATSARASRVTASNTSAGARPSGPGSGSPSLICSFRPATRISKNSSSFDETMVMKRSRSSSGTVSSAACASTRRLNAMMPSSRFRNCAGRAILRFIGDATAGTGIVMSGAIGEMTRSVLRRSSSDSIWTAPVIEFCPFARRFFITVS